MFGFRRSKADASPSTESDTKQNLPIGKRNASESQLPKPNFKFDDEEEDVFAPRKTNKNTSKDTGYLTDSDDFDNMSMQQLEGYAVNKAEETTNSVNNCVKIAENIRGDATRTLDTLYQQGEQINRTHMKAVELDKDLSKGEKLLGNLGGMFSKTWKPKKTKEITGPVMHDNSSKTKASKQDRQKLGLDPAPKERSGSRTPNPELSSAMQRVEDEKAKQDDGLDDLSGILGDLKGMAVEMGSELEKQNKDIDHLYEDIEEVNSRVKGSNQRARRLVGK